MIKVEILNPKTVKELYKRHGEFACECYDTPSKYAEKVGKVCQESGHYSGSRTEYIKFKVSGVDRGIAEQALRHELGVRFDDFVDISIDPTMIVKNMKSFRYVDINDKFDYTIPTLIQKSERATARYNKTMAQIKEGLKDVKDILDMEFPTMDNKLKLEATQYQLPRATNTSFVIGMTLEALFHYHGKRLCIRAQEKHRELAIKMKEAIEEINKDISDKLTPICEYLLWCPEGKMGCGAYPTKDELRKEIAND